MIMLIMVIMIIMIKMLILLTIMMKLIMIMRMNEDDNNKNISFTHNFPHIISISLMLYLSPLNLSVHKCTCVTCRVLPYSYAY